MTKEEFCKRLKDINLTQKEFSEITNVPYSTLNNWGFHDIQVPTWVEPFLKHYSQSIKYDKVKKQVVQLLLEEMKQRKQNSTNQNKD